MEEQEKRRIRWYRTRLDRSALAALNRRSDVLGFAQTLGFLGVLTATGAAVWYASAQLSWPWFALGLLVHGTCYAFMINGFHELCHSSVFRTQWLNALFLHVLSFLGWYNPVHFWASHSEHHKYALHVPEDGEVVLPVFITLKGYLKAALVNPMGMYQRWKGTIRRGVFGRLAPGWESILFPAVPCYRLGALHRAIRHDLPSCPAGLIATWREIAAIQKRQRVAPDYQYTPELPAASP